MGMEDETIRYLEEQKKRKRRTSLVVVFFLVGVLAVINVLFLVILGLILMFVGVITSMSTGNSLLEWRYYHTNMRSGFDDVFKEERKDRAANFGLGMVMSVGGLLLFIAGIYLYSSGWFGLISVPALIFQL